MARRSSGSGWWVGVLIIVAILASISKEVWVGIFIAAGIGLVAYFLLRLIRGNRAPEPKPAPAIQQPKVAPPDKVANKQPTLSDNDILIIRQRVESAGRAFNEAKNAASKAKDRGTREYKLQIAREKLVELKRLVSRFPFLRLENIDAVEADMAGAEAETRAMSYTPGIIFPREVDRSVTPQTCWIGPDKEVDVKGLGSIGGMLYFGRGLASVNEADVEPALINPNLQVVWPKGGNVDRMPYWPSYARISPASRGEYLTWLAGGRKAPDVQMGCVFLFFYGIERRAIAENQIAELAGEWPALLTEVRRLLTIYDSNGSFYSYANRFLDFAVALDAKDRIYKLSPPAQGVHRLLMLRHKMALGQAAVDGVPLPANWAYSWLINDERFWPRAPAKNCPDEFQKLFLTYYKDTFADGLKLPVNKTLLKAIYQAASSSFGGKRIELPGPSIPDVTVLEKPFNELKRIAERATEALRPYSRYVGKHPDRKTSGEAIALLPAAIWPADVLHSLTAWLVQMGVNTAPQVTTYGQLVDHLPPGLSLKKDALATLCSSLEHIGVGMEPDVRWGGPMPAADTKTVFFPLSEEEVGAAPSSLYSAARLTLQLGATVAAADGIVSLDEQQHLQESLERWAHLSAAELTRLRAHLKWLLISPPSLTALKRQIAGLKHEQKYALAAFLVSTAQASGQVTPAEVRVLTKIYRQLEFDEKELFSQLHVAATSPVTVQPATRAHTGYSVPPKPAQSKVGAIILDPERIAALTADSQRVTDILTSIFAENEPSQEPAPTPESEEPAAETSIAGLDVTLSDLVRVLVSRDTWTRAELSDLAADLGIMLDGAMERINEAFLDAKDIPLLEGDDPVEVNGDIVKELQAA